ncbi:MULTISPECIES: molybdopterin-dependent oxidoreductase [Paenibacillus]|uniref:molybdopterin-dependent oxidoreductase n=1 Tax=Paenibacillus TaxID=44249 RepID=UPI0022B86A60|nr:molybdopterin-dependent oxidoreductase [Paenibacillus caseinilyticus]MCZ8524135.1 molybdopterin-dependent oxidoreductase [Paenibacillus caseinilyticus]
MAHSSACRYGHTALHEPLRELGQGRVLLKDAHVWLGLLSMLVLLLYLPLLRKHWRQLSQRPLQRWNLGGVLFLLAGWSITGVLLWQLRRLDPAWGNAALLLHDGFTWVGVPYAVYHSISRSRWVKAAKSQRPPVQGQPGEAAPAPAADGLHAASESEARRFVRRLQEAPISRAAFLRIGAGLLLVLGLGPAFYRWLKQSADSGGTALESLAESDGNRMLPEPVPLPASNPPVGGGSQGRFRVYTVTPIPSFDSKDWQFALTGLVEKEQLWDWDTFNTLKRVVQVSDFHCITGWSVYQVTWEGIPLRELMDLAGMKDTAKFVKLYSGDGVYTDCLSLEQARLDDVMVAVLMDGKPIPQQLGGPVRLVVPRMYAYKSVKWLQAIELVEKEHTGYWELRGYEQNAWVKGGGLS